MEKSVLAIFLYLTVSDKVAFCLQNYFDYLSEKLVKCKIGCFVENQSIYYVMYMYANDRCPMTSNLAA